MTDAIKISRELKPCPFCGEIPELPSGDGTQYEIECTGCGQAMASVQICDLMTIEERVSDSFTAFRYGEEFVERAKAEAIENWNRRAQPPEQPGAWEREAFEALRSVVAYDEMAEDDEGSLMTHYSDMMRLARAALSSASKEGT